MITWTGAPLVYTADYYSPTDLEATFQRYRFENGNFACVPRSRMSHGRQHEKAVETPGHLLHMHTADERCQEAGHQHNQGELPGGMIFEPACHCHSINTRENGVVEFWHDDVLPGWCVLPIMPKTIRPMSGGVAGKTKAALCWISKHYPDEWQ